MMYTKILKATVAGLLLGSQLQASQCWDAPPEICQPSNSCIKRFWVDAEYLLWKIQDSPPPIPLVMEGDSDSPLLRSPGNAVVLGTSSIRNDLRSGAKLTAGYWLDEAGTSAVELSYFVLPTASRVLSVSSSGLPGSAFFGVPFFNVNTLREDAYDLAVPGDFSGSASFKVTHWMQGIEVNRLKVLKKECSYEMDVLLGFRYWNFNEQSTFVTNSPLIDTPTQIYKTTDKFTFNNDFYGGQIGVKFNYLLNKLSFNTVAKFAMGANCGRIRVHGDFSTNAFNTIPNVGEPQSYEGGIFALTSTIGNNRKTYFCMIPEVNFNVAFQLLESVKVQAGYTFLFVNKVFWGSNQLNRNINPTQSPAIEFTPTPELVGEASPIALHKTQSLWVQGINLGIVISF